MLINKLELENFGVTEEKQTITFKKGINLITGDNGKGKSTAVKALSLMLFNYAKGRHQDYINWNKDFFKTMLDLEHAGHKYEVKFSAGRGSDGKLLTIDNDDYYERSEANDKLAELFNPKLMLASMISFEGETDLITVKPAERREHLKKIYDLDFKNEIIRIKSLIDSLTDNDIANIEKEILVLESIEYDINELKELPFDEETYNSYIQLTEANSERIKSAVELNSNRKQLVEKLVNLKLNASNLENDLNSLELSYSNLNEQEKPVISDSIYDALNKYKLSLESFNDDNVKLLEDEISTFRKKRPISIDEDKLSTITSEAGVLLLEISNLNKKIKDLESGTCPTCGGEIKSTDISSWQSDLKDLEEKSKLKKIEIASHKEEIVKKKEIDDFNLNVKEMTDKLNSDIEKLKIKNLNDKKDLEKSIEYEEKSIEASKKNIKLETEVLENKIIEADKKISDKNKSIENCKKEIDDTQVSIDSSELIDIEDIENENEIILGKISEYIQISTERNLIIKKNESEELRKIAATSKIKDLKIERDTLASEVAEYKEQKDILNKRFPSFVIATLIKTIEFEMNDFIIKTYEGKYTIKIVEKKDAIYVVYGAKEADVSLASGYEKQVFSLAYKNALNKISGTGVLILDEVDSASSIENSLQLYKIVGSMTDLYQQIIIITHKPEVQELLINEYNALAYEVDNGKFRRIA